MNKNNYELSVCVNGRPVREYGHKGNTFIEGRHGLYYTVKFRNNTAARVMAVVSVDGLDVVDGKAATNESRGYIVPGYQSIEVKGWRTSKKKVNTFIFDTKPRAYSTQSQGEDLNCGVVAVKVFCEALDLQSFFTLPKEEHHHHHYHEWPRPAWNQTPFWCGPNYGAGTGLGANSEPTYACNVTASGGSNQMASGGSNQMTSGNLMGSGMNNASANFLAPAPAPAQENPNFNLGTGWGGELEDEIEEVKFKRGSELAELTVYYSDEQGLRDAGIEVDKKPAVSKPTLPKAFHGFCTPPVVTST